MKSFLKVLSLTVATLLFVVACSSGPTLKEQLMMGEWEGEVQGFPVTLKYTETEIEVVGMGMSLPYTLEGDQMTFEVPGQGAMSFTVEVDGDTLTQTDASGTSSTLKRKM